MSKSLWQEKIVEKTITYTLLKDGKFYLVENVPARVNVETGEQFFSPQTIERLQRIIWEQDEPIRIIETPVYEFSG